MRTAYLELPLKEIKSTTMILLYGEYFVVPIEVEVAFHSYHFLKLKVQESGEAVTQQQ